MIPIQRHEFEFIIANGIGEVSLRGLPMSILSLPIEITNEETREINEKFCEQVIDAYMEAASQITDWE